MSYACSIGNNERQSQFSPLQASSCPSTFTNEAQTCMTVFRNKIKNASLSDIMRNMIFGKKICARRVIATLITYKEEQKRMHKQGQRYQII
jgi:hypothetical protein